MTKDRPALSDEDLVKAFRRATGSVENAALRWRQRAEQGLDDGQLAAALAYELGLVGGECGDEITWLEYQGDGLKIWASKGWLINRHCDPPTLQGAQTIRMARAVYGIPDPGNRQFGLF